MTDTVEELFKNCKEATIEPAEKFFSTNALPEAEVRSIAETVIGAFVLNFEGAGFRIVHPDHVTEEMFRAGELADRDCPADGFKAMLSAAPRFTEKEND